MKGHVYINPRPSRASNSRMHTAVSYIARLSWALTKSQSGKEGRAFRNIGKNIYIFPTVKSAMPLLFNIFTYCCLDPSLGFGPSFL